MNTMKEFKSVIIATITGLCAIVCVVIAVTGFTNYKKDTNSGNIAVTGSASKDFTSDLIVWRGSFSASGETPEEAYKEIKNNSEIVKKYLTDSGVPEDEIIFSSVSISQEYDSGFDVYSELYQNIIANSDTTAYDNFVESYGFDPMDLLSQSQFETGYSLYQEVSVTSSDVDKIEGVSRDITKLIESGVTFTSSAPEYYYTKLEDLKLEMIEAATQNAKTRIDIIASNAQGRIGSLQDASLGVFQIIAQNSDSEEYSYGGTFNTTSKEKTATVTIRLSYDID